MCFDACMRAALLAALVAWAVGLAASARAQDDGPPRSGHADHTPGSSITIVVEAGAWLLAANCGAEGVWYGGDTTLALYDPSGTRVAYSDDACGGLGSRLVHQAEVSGAHRLEMSCYGGGSECSGRVAWSVSAEAPSESATYLSFEGALEARALLGPEGQAALLDAWAELAIHPDFLAVRFRVEGSPMGVGGGRGGGVLAGGVQASVALDLHWAELGIGGGVAVLSRRPEGVVTREAGTLVLRFRAGLRDDFRVSAALALAITGEEDATDIAFDGRVVLPIGMVELTGRALYGFQGVWLGDLGVVIWPDGASRRGLGVALFAGGSAIFYQPVCRFGLVCDTTLYAGPHVGVGIHIRP